MDIAQYIVESERTERKFPNGMIIDAKRAEILHAGMGLSTEAGEAMDQLKRHLIYGKPLDMINLLEEIGDLMWYVAIILRWAGVPLEQVLQANIDKLRARFPEKFTEENALQRDLGMENAILNKALDTSKSWGHQ